MADPFRRLLLDTVAVVIAKPPNSDSLIELLRIASPELDPTSALQNPAQREKLFKTLKLRIHPDKHPGDLRVTELYQNVQAFYDKCVTDINRRRPRQQHPPSMNNYGRSTNGAPPTTAPPPYYHANTSSSHRAPPQHTGATAAPYPPQQTSARQTTTTAAAASSSDPYQTYAYNPSTDSHYVSYETTNYADGLVYPKYRPTVSWSCCCHHLTNLIALTMVCAFMGFAGYVCYYVLGNSG